MTTRPTTAEIAGVILDHCRKRGAEKSICPSEAARSLAGSGNAWQGLMEDVRQVAGHLAEAGLIEVCQKGNVVSIATAKGPIRLRIKPDGR